jgi:UDP-3-O-[3-hydroxymyristoyl] N-acetylglucosamine deacetylase
VASARSPIRLEGHALHAGCRTAVRFAEHDGPITFVQGDRRAPLGSLSVARTDWGLELSDGQGLTIDLAEHLLAALGGLGIHRGVMVTVDGPEVPILDGGARRMTEALRKLEVAGSPPGLCVRRSARFGLGSAEYVFEPATGVTVEADVSFDHPAIGRQRTLWNGDPERFARDIAPCRTFGFTRDERALRDAGRAKLVRDGEGAGVAVLVFTDRGLLDPAAAPSPNEIVGHKLLDLIGDLTLYGGPPEGRVFARQPGHTATHAVVRQALSQGVLARAC